MHSNITDDQLLPIVEAIRGHSLLERLSLLHNNIGDTGCETLATLRNLTFLNIADNDITDEGMIAFANSISENSCLRELDLDDDYSANPFEFRVVAEDFCRSLCNTSNINTIYLSNHTLESIPSYQNKGSKLVSLLKLNKSTTNKRHVAIKKILLHCPHDIDMEPLFDLSVEEDEDGSGQDLKALPHVISWFETAKDAISIVQFPIWKKLSANDLERRKLSAIYQFATAMPVSIGLKVVSLRYVVHPGFS